MSNGNIPDSQLVKLSTVGRLTKPAAKSYERMRIVALKVYKVDLRPTGEWDAYRERAVQEKVFFERYTTTNLNPRNNTWGNGGIKTYNGKTYYKRPNVAVAATPGTSNHGWGIAVDFRNAGNTGGPEYKFLKKYGKRFGWDNVEGSRIGEPWHWVYKPENDKKAKTAGRYKVVKATGRGKKAATYRTRKATRANVARRLPLCREVTVVVVWGKWAELKKGDWIRKGKIGR